MVATSLYSSHKQESAQKRAIQAQEEEAARARQYALEAEKRYAEQEAERVRKAENTARALQEEANQRQLEAEQRALETYQATAYPSSEAVSAMQSSGQAQLAQAKAGSYQQMAADLASRGIGPGSGIMAGGASDIETGYLQSLSSMAKQLQQFAATPQYSPPSNIFGQATPTITPSAEQPTPYIAPSYGAVNYSPVYSSSLTDLLSSAGGMYLASQLIGGSGGYTSSWSPGMTEYMNFMELQPGSVPYATNW